MIELAGYISTTSETVTFNELITQTFVSIQIAMSDVFRSFLPKTCMCGDNIMNLRRRKIDFILETKVGVETNFACIFNNADCG